MSPLNKIIVAGVFVLTGLLLVIGCGSSTTNSKSSFSNDGEKHPAGWLPLGHKTAAMANQGSCSECHGSDYLGGISKVSCSECHLGGVDSVHPKEWAEPVALNHSAYVKANGNESCANMYCHGTTLEGVDKSGPSCSSCHLGGPTSVHPLDWAGGALVTKHGEYVSTVRSYASCATIYCHGVNLEGVIGSGHSCSRCH